MNEQLAWKVYNFINSYKEGNFGFISLQEALDKYYDGWEAPKPLKQQIGNTI